MNEAPRSRTLLLIAVVLVGSGSVAAADSEYSLTSPSTVDTPDRTVTIEEKSFAVTEIARVSPGDELVVDASAPPDTTYNVYLYDADRRIVATSDGGLSGDASTRFGTDSLTPGSYVATIYRDGEFEALLPVVVSGYGVAVVVELAPADGSSARASVTATLTPEPNAPAPSRVELVVARSDAGRVVDRTTMSGSGSEYRASTRLDRGEEYTFYVNVRGGSVTTGRQAFLGVSDPIAVAPTDGSEFATTVIESGTRGASTSAHDVTNVPSTTTDGASSESDGVLTPNPTTRTTTRTDLPVGVLPALVALSMLVVLIRRT
ncbi:hypothetical protein [Salinigranum sp. GCM10025319]|uniref:hypothetical protein n=1 Tax=Salinigranum sp. GCM10025319 TaxID=3252687 RepID=UPI00360D77C3